MSKQEKIVRWDLSGLYTGSNDPQIEKDIATCVEMMEKFGGLKGQLKSSLAEALTIYVDLNKLWNKLGIFAYNNWSTQVDNDDATKLRALVDQKLSEAYALHMNYFSHEILAMSGEEYAACLTSADIVRHHKPMLDDVRNSAKYFLSEEVEQALSLRDSYGSGEWDEFCDEMEADLEFTIKRRKRTLTEALELLSDGETPEIRLEAMQKINAGLAKQFTRFRARALNAVMGEKMVEDKQRGYEKPISSRNFHSKLDDSVVDALHEAVGTVGSDQCARFYKLKFALMGKEGAQPWSERNANMPFASKEKVSWEKTKKLVLEAYASFSPTLADLVDMIIKNNWVDVHPYKGKSGGAYNYSATMPDGEYSFNFLNHQGSVRDVMTAAHELGHGVHGLLAGAAQGPLMQSAPMVYAETASIFGEMITFNHLMANVSSDEERLALLISKTDDFMNSVVRQISFSDFEQIIHDKRREGKLSVEDFNEVWLEVTRKYYGDDGDVFKYDDMENMWSYIGHFMNPFYVYAYAFGELFTQSLFAVKDNFGDEFEPMYLDLLRKGGTEGAVDLMKPFGLDPKDPNFWVDGINCSVTAWLDEAERLAKKLGKL